MTTWTEDELRTMGAAEELELSSLRDDGTLRPYVTVWVVRVGEDVYVRSGWGRENGWFRRALRRRLGRVRVAGIERDIAFEDPDASATEAIDAAYHVKYDRFGERHVSPVVSAEAADATFRLAPR